MSKRKYVCSECGSRNVEINVWVNVNKPKVDDDIPTLLSQALQEESFCNECQCHTDIISQESFREKQLSI